MKGRTMWLLWKFLDYVLLYPRHILRIGPASHAVEWLDEAWLTIMLLTACGFVWIAFLYFGIAGTPFGHAPLGWALLLYLAVGFLFVSRSFIYVISEILREYESFAS